MLIVANFLPPPAFALCSFDGLAADAGIVDRCGHSRFISLERAPTKEILARQRYALRLQYRKGGDRTAAEHPIPGAERRTPYCRV